MSTITFEKFSPAFHLLFFRPMNIPDFVITTGPTQSFNMDSIPAGGVYYQPPTKTATATVKSTRISTVSTVTRIVVPPDPEIFPLTTIWTPPCNSVFHLSDAKTKSCLPPDASPDWIEDGGYYSPGICFSGYTSGCEFKPTGVEGGVSAAICVPRYIPPFSPLSHHISGGY